MNPGEIPDALFDIASQQLTNDLHPPVKSLLERLTPANPLQVDGESTVDAVLRINIGSMNGGRLVIQGRRVLEDLHRFTYDRFLLAAGKKVGVTSNSHKAVVNLLKACGDAAQRNGRQLVGLKVGDEPDKDLHQPIQILRYVQDTGAARAEYSAGIIAGDGWLFSRPEWKDQPDFLFIDEAGQVSLARRGRHNAVEPASVLLGDTSNWSNRSRGSHPGDAGLSGSS